MVSTANHTYLLRVWREPEHDGPALFRAALTDVVTRETYYFADVLSLAEHLATLQEPADSGER